MRYTQVYNGLQIVNISDNKVTFQVKGTLLLIECVITKKNPSVYYALQDYKDYYLHHRDTILFTIITNFTDKGYELESYHEYDYSNWR